MKRGRAVVRVFLGRGHESGWLSPDTVWLGWCRWLLWVCCWMVIVMESALGLFYWIVVVVDGKYQFKGTF